VIPEWLQIASVIASPLFAAGAAYAAVRVELSWHRREIERAHERIDDHDDRLFEILKGHRP